jgi:hypothetical protein
MRCKIYVPPSVRTAERHLCIASTHSLKTLSKSEFLRAWCSLIFLYPGLHPDGYNCRGSGWPKALKAFAAEAWRRFQSGEITDNELYCYQACKARVLKERGIMAIEASKKPWFFTDHFSA